MDKLIIALVMFLFVTSTFGANRAIEGQGGGGPSELEYKMTEQAEAEFQKSGDIKARGF